MLSNMPSKTQATKPQAPHVQYLNIFTRFLSSFQEI